LVIFNLLFLGVVTYIQHENGKRWHSIFELIVKQCGETK